MSTTTITKERPSGADYTLSINADSGYQSTTQGRCTPEQYGAAIAALHGNPTAKERELQAEVERLRTENERLQIIAANHLRDHARASHMWELMVLPMQAAAIEAEETNAEEAMRWITNTLIGPGLYPDLEDAKAAGGAQAWFDREKTAEEARYDGVCNELGPKVKVPAVPPAQQPAAEVAA
jgi:hypothetical protein